MHTRTRKNLYTAMWGEAYAYARYLLFAEQAQRNGRPELAELFEHAAYVERFEHFAQEAELTQFVCSDEVNLRTAITAESYDADAVYADFARQASEVGDKALAARFAKIRDDKVRHRDAFLLALRHLEASEQSEGTA
jgi:rubrerythrin